MTDAVVFTTVKDVFLCSVTKTSMGHSFDKILHIYFKIITMYLLQIYMSDWYYYKIDYPIIFIWVFP